MKTLFAGVFLSLSLVCAPVLAQDKKKDKKDQPPKSVPTAADVKYGTHERQVLDFYQAKSDRPTPVVLHIHGGGWQNGDKSGAAGFARKYLSAGVSVVSINYRYLKNGVDMKIEPPVKAPIDDAARALQFVRSRAAEWNIDKKRIGVTGGSAGACSSLWLAFHKDLADPKSDDPIARESTRPYCAAVSGAQVTLDPRLLREWIPNYTYGAKAFGMDNFQELYDNREKVLKWIKEYSPMEHAGKDAPPIFLEYANQKVPPVPGEKQADPTHSAVMGLKLEERLKAAGVEVILVYPGRTHPQYKTSADFLIDRLRK